MAHAVTAQERRQVPPGPEPDGGGDSGSGRRHRVPRRPPVRGGSAGPAASHVDGVAARPPRQRARPAALRATALTACAALAGLSSRAACGRRPPGRRSAPTPRHRSPVPRACTSRSTTWTPTTPPSPVPWTSTAPVPRTCASPASSATGSATSPSRGAHRRRARTRPLPGVRTGRPQDPGPRRGRPAPRSRRLLHRLRPGGVEPRLRGVRRGARQGHRHRPRRVREGRFRRRGPGAAASPGPRRGPGSGDAGLVVLGLRPRFAEFR